MSNFYLEIEADDTPGSKADRPDVALLNTKLQSTIGDISLRRSSRTGEIVVDSPLTTADQLYYRAEPDRLCISNDFRRLASKECRLNPAGIYSLLQFGTVVPSTTLWDEIREFKPGFQSRIRVGDELAAEEPTTIWPTPDAEDRTMKIHKQKEIVCDLVDEILLDACPNRDPVILFSGGVDSGLMAARAAAMGWRDTTLVNLSFGPDDSESKLAEEMAKLFGLTFVRVNALDFDELSVLDDVTTCYSRPFGDPSASPTHTLVKSIVARFPESRPILDGTGADGAFGLASKLRFYRVAELTPDAVLDSVSAIYKTTGLWKTTLRLERFARIVRRCAQLPIFLAAIARNPLADIAYTMTRQTQEEVLEGLDKWISMSCQPCDLGFKAPVADLAVNCSRVLAQKTKSPLDFYGRTIKYPFLDERMVRLAMGRALKWPRDNEPKWVLKALLSDFVPSDMVYRKKSGFIGPYRDILSRDKFIASLDRLINDGGELGSYLDYDVITQLRARVRNKAQLPGQTYWFLWALVFFNNWLAGQPPIHDRSSEYNLRNR